MKKVNVKDLAPLERQSPGGKFGCRYQNVTGALGGRTEPTPAEPWGAARHPFDVGLVTLPPGKRLCPYHSHAVEHEFYLVVSGRGQARHEGGVEAIGPGDCFVFPPGEPHQMICPDDATEPLVYWVIADNTKGTDVCFYPDSGKWAGLPGKGTFRISEAGYFDGEE